MLQRRARLRGRPWPRLVANLPAAALTVAVVAASTLSCVRLHTHYIHQVEDRDPPLYLPASQVAAFEWMDREIPDDAVIFVSYATGSYVPRMTGNPVFIGEDMLTEAVEQRIFEVQGFFGLRWADSRRLELLQRFGVDYVFYGPEERQLGRYVPANASFLETTTTASRSSRSGRPPRPRAVDVTVSFGHPRGRTRA